MGWILFREGRPQEARKFLEAAWRNMQDPVIGTHLGDVWMALKDKPGEAYNAYELVSAINGSTG